MEHEAIILAMTHQSQVRMAKAALAGWTFRKHCFDGWIAQRPEYFDQYGATLMTLVDRLDTNNPEVVRRRDQRWS